MRGFLLTGVFPRILELKLGATSVRCRQRTQPVIGVITEGLALRPVSLVRSRHGADTKDKTDDRILVAGSRKQG